MYSYRAMFEMLLSYGTDAKKLQLTSELYYKDDLGSMESTLLAPAKGIQPNHSLLKHHMHALQSHEFNVVGYIHIDI